jgi:hypothetical protein
MEKSMRRKSQILALTLGITLALGSPFISPKRAEVQAGQAEAIGQLGLAVGLSLFNQMLSPHGNWVDVENYGPCWQPRGVPTNYQPYYTNGHWAYTDYGWTWVSDDPWGDVTYHYGSWYNDTSHGWLWVPGYTWSPAWVTWQYTNDYVGWAPLPPSYAFDVGRNRYNSWDSFYNSGYNYNTRPVVVNQSYYVFVPANQINSTYLTRVRVPYNRNYDLIRRARPATTYALVNGYVVNPGPNIQGVERFRRNRVPISQALRSARLQPRSVVLSQGGDIRVAAPSLTRQQARQVRLDIREARQQNRIERREQNRTQELQQDQLRQQRQLNRQQQRSTEAEQQRQQELQLENTRQQRRVERQQQRGTELQQEQLRRQQRQEGRRSEELQQQQLREQRRLERQQNQQQIQDVHEQRRIQRQQNQQQEQIEQQQRRQMRQQQDDQLRQQRQQQRELMRQQQMQQPQQREQIHQQRQMERMQQQQQMQQIRQQRQTDRQQQNQMQDQMRQQRQMERQQQRQVDKQQRRENRQKGNNQ